MFKCLVIVSTLFLMSAAHADDSLLQTKKRDLNFQTFIDTLDLGASNVQLDYKSGSTSVGLKILIDKPDDEVVDYDYKAYWLPNENGAANSQGQVVAYYLGRFLKMSKVVLPSAYLSVQGDDLIKFKDLLMKHYGSERGKWKLQNRDKVLAAVNSNIKNNKSQLGAISLKKKKFAVDSLVNWRKNTLNSNHALAALVKADKRMPSKVILMGLKEVRLETGQVNTSTEYTLARDLSRILVLDMLTGQWDRFSGGNMEARFDKDKKNPGMGEVRLFARDNGGASVSSKYPTGKNFKKYLPLVTRFDREQVEKLKELESLLIESPELAKETLRVLSDRGISTMLQRVAAVLQHVEKQVSVYGDEKVFFQ